MNSRNQEHANRCARATILMAPGMIRDGKSEWVLNIIASQQLTDQSLKAGLLETQGDAVFALGNPDYALDLYEEAKEAYGRAVPDSLQPKIAKARARIKTGKS